MTNQLRTNYLVVAYVLLTFFFISFLTNILGSLNPSASESFGLSKTMVAFLPFAFFLAYGIMSIPAGLLLERVGQKRLLLTAFFLALLGSLLFVAFPNFTFFLVALFTIGCGMAILQVVINPLLRVSGGEENYAFTSVLGQLCFGLASFVAPLIYTLSLAEDEAGLSSFLNQIAGHLVVLDLRWVSIYVIFALFAVGMLVVTLFLKLPKTTQNEDERIGDLNSFTALLKSKTVIFFFLGIFAYVGVEQGISFWISKFLYQYHGFDFETVGAKAVANFWGLMTIGGLVGLVLLKLLDSKLVLKLFTSLTMVCLLSGLFGPKQFSLYGFQACGFFMAVMYPIIISLALNSVKEMHGSFAGILMTGIVGGALFQLLIGFLGDLTSLRFGMIFNFIGLLYILFIAFWAKPLIKNKTVKIKSKG
ncbi:MFS transporter [Flagellimonas allohymeniacidonis]|uniref:MFS transporter n=1 Tax=Flagellimonas allohymeniacidonis TaxID=2517819 RepID=A0A4Q8QIE3_9FLAO|nr:MFS transporter [Allomuricauda hymeniacidonis]TAI49774.1 MFS transporter [Allomuricauda hymeniacidonis]